MLGTSAVLYAIPVRKLLEGRGDDRPLAHDALSADVDVGEISSDDALRLHYSLQRRASGHAVTS